MTVSLLALPDGRLGDIDTAAAQLLHIPCEDLADADVILLAHTDPWQIATGDTPPQSLIAAQMLRGPVPMWAAGTQTRLGKTTRRNRQIVRLKTMILSPRHLSLEKVDVDLAPKTLVWVIRNWEELNGQMQGQIPLPLQDDDEPADPSDDRHSLGGDPLADVYARHPMVAQVNAAFEAAGGTWAALLQRPLVRRDVRREMEAVIRENLASPEALLREVLGYLDMAVTAAYDWGRTDAATGSPAS